MILEHGAEAFWQWNSGQAILLQDAEREASWASLSTNRQDAALQQVENGRVPVPGVLLEKAGTLYVFLHRGTRENLTTMDGENQFTIRPQPKPKDYVKPEDRLCWHQLDERITALEQTGGGTLTPEQVKTLNSVPGKLDKAGHTANKYLGTDDRGNVVEKEAPEGDAVRFDPDPQDDPVENSRRLQARIDAASAAGGGVIHIPAGSFRFGSTGQARGIDFCVRMKSHVSVYGEGTATVLLPVGQTEKGLDLFYFNDYREKNQANYLENCRFADFVIDAAGTSCRTYSTGGKGFMLNLIRNCHWRNVTVLRTDGTGIGVDCPILCSIDHCHADGCGKGAVKNSGEIHGASGIGIGYGYSNQESMEITNCHADNNRNYGIFYEHQGRFKPDLYGAQTNLGLKITNCSCQGNGCNYGAERATGVMVAHSYSNKAKTHGYCVTNSAVCTISDCVSNVDTDGSYVVKTVPNDPYEHTEACKDIVIAGCTSKYSGSGVKLCQDANGTAAMERITVTGNAILAPQTEVLSTVGTITDLFITGNNSESKTLRLTATGTGHVVKGNSWQEENGTGLPENADALAAAVPAGLPPETPKTAQGVMDALAAQHREASMGTSNLFDRSRRTAGTAINPVNGEEIPGVAEESATEYIPVLPDTDYKLGFFFADDTDNSIVANVAWYDAEHRFISGGNGENLRSPAKAAYVRFSCSDIVFTSEYYRPYFGPLSYWKDAKSDDYVPCEVQARYLTPLSILGQGKVSYEFADADVVYRVTVRETVIGHILMSDGSYVHFDLPNHSTYDIPPTKILVYDCMAHRVRVINQKSLLSWYFVLLQTVDATADYRSHLRGWLTEMQYNPPAVEPYNLNNVSKVYARKVDDKSIEAANISPDGFSFVIHTDMHINTPLPDSTSPTLAVVNRISAQLHPDVILNLGDNVSFGQADHAEQAYYSLQESVSRIEEKDRAYYVIGNHDYNHDSRISTDRQPRAAIIPYHAAYSILGRQHEADVVWGSKDRMYYYKDFPDRKIRMIMLNTSDRPEAWVNIDGTEYDKYTWLKNPVGSAQVDWLIDTALNFAGKSDKAEWSVVFLSHVTPAPNVEYNDAPLYNGDILVKITEAFKTGTSKALSFTDTVFDGYASVNRRCDFASQGAMTVIGWFSGHTHLDTQTVINGITYTPMVCGYADPGVPNSNAMAGMTMVKGEYTEFGVDYCVLDKSARTVTLKRYGIGKDRTVKY